MDEKLIFTKGAVIRNAGSTEKNKTGSWKTFKPVLKKSECIKCGICWENCSEAAIKKNNKGEFEIDYNYCKGCGICAKECLKKAIEMVLDEK